MLRMPVRVLFLLSLFLFSIPSLSGPAGAQSAEQPAAALTAGNVPSPLIMSAQDIVSDKTLDEIGAEIRSIYTSGVTEQHAGHSALDLSALLQRATAVSTRTDRLMARIRPYQDVYQNFVDILGKPPAKDDPPEASSLTEQRESLNRRQKDISARMTRLKLYQVEAQQLVNELRQHDSAIQQATLWQQMPSPLGVNFWSQFIQSAPQDGRRLNALGAETLAMLATALTGKRFFITLAGLSASLLLLAGWLYARKPIRLLTTRFLPQGRVRPIAATVLCGVVSVLACAISFQVFWNTLAFDNPAVGDDLDQLASMVATQAPLCGLVLELGFCFLSSKADWRVFAMSDDLARSLRLFPAWLAIAMIVRGMLRYVDTQSGLSLLSVQLVDGLYTLTVSPLLFAIPRKLRLTAAQDQDADTAAEPAGTTEQTPPLAQFLRSMAMGISIICWIAVLTGYIPLAYTLISWVSVMALSMTTLLLLSMLTTALGGALFASRAPLGRHLVELGLPPRLINQASILVPGLINVLLLAVAYAVASSGANFDPPQIWQQLYSLFHGTEDSNTSSVSLDAILLCIALPLVGYQAIKIVKSWFQQRFFPATNLDIGAQASILSILGYAAWILIGLAMFAALGVTVKSMTWVVSALSVGIGFGLQSIVQNFVSGIILMAERPVSVGDVVTIAGVTGKVERISVRSTDIRLDDKSTMIVPNSQFITSAVKNATRAQKPGVFTVELDLPFASDLNKASAVVIATLSACADTDPDSAPTVSMTSVADGSAVLTGSAKARDGVEIKTARSSALFAIWQAFQENEIPVTFRQTVRAP
ncbi:DUF3772 domain-containing protein [Acetobacter lambici]|uniref:DUF3772 domain-containing protein n=1 Tax=Acetobacter lambici TaxID=1332824 RepID=A0ABT1EZE3_9PROT|nr:DUF3772 domain-containing protein [Acetobacter lambici]MCP1242105.1 DUF3772 domain-containing protein [Acetobacter lambici]MCP1258121.1 DUF3772 domain-containing protein [Acetobacter lambici]NHO56580.1 DUF3772 domain-containing protein [Acetobacter lambici]